VLRAREIPFVIVRNAGEHVIAVPVARADEARSELSRYAEENAGWPPERAVPATLASGRDAAIVWTLVTAVLFLLDRGRLFSLPWHDAGRVDGERIASGEWWRTLTSLTLHADLSHLFGNVIFGAVFAALSCQLLGTGIGMLGILLAGAVGNLINVAVQGGEHLAVGASTAVFGAIGLQTSFLWAHRREQRYPMIYVWAPVVLGLAFLAFLGMPQWEHSEVVENLRRTRDTGGTDYTAHATGFVAGVLLGVLAGRLPRTALSSATAQRLAGAAALALLAGAWALALVSR
jgi:membrane associated rhomboid family serine protease